MTSKLTLTLLIFHNLHPSQIKPNLSLNGQKHGNNRLYLLLLYLCNQLIVWLWQLSEAIPTPWVASKWHHGLVRSDYSENWSCGNKCGRIPNHFCNTNPKKWEWYCSNGPLEGHFGVIEGSFKGQIVILPVVSSKTTLLKISKISQFISFCNFRNSTSWFAPTSGWNSTLTCSVNP